MVRTHNEDNLLIDDARRVYAVADGLGGIPNGEKASQLAIQMVGDFYDDTLMRGDLFLREMFDQINGAVYKQGHYYSPDLGMATTLTLVQITGNGMAIGHVGDSAVFLYRAGTVRQLTEDHTMKVAIERNLAKGDYEFIPEALSHTLTRCIGHQMNVDVDTISLPLQAGDRILLCTDGITKYVSPEFMERAFAVALTPERLVKMLLNEARDLGGMDNATAVSVYVGGTTPKIFGLSK
jgi:protein phosphatase